MDNIFSTIGTIASVASIPIAVYLFIKGRENKLNKIKREIVRTLLFHLNDARLISNFEIQSVINSKLRDNKIGIDKIGLHEVVEDLIFEIVSNPLLALNDKKYFITNLESICNIPHTNTKKQLTYVIEKEERTIIEKVEGFNNQGAIPDYNYWKQLQERSRLYLSTIFALVSTTFIFLYIIFSIITPTNKDFNVLSSFKNFPQLYVIAISMIISAVSIVIALIVKLIQIKMKKEKIKIIINTGANEPAAEQYGQFPEDDIHQT